MYRFAANLNFLFCELPFQERFRAAARCGFRGVEFRDCEGLSATAVADQLHENSLELILFNGTMGNWEAGDRGLAAMVGRQADFDRELEQAMQFARITHCSRIHIMSGLETHDGRQFETLVANLQNAGQRAAEENRVLLIEPINTIDMPGYWLNRTTQAVDVLREVASRHVGLQFDIYHRQRAEGNVVLAMEESFPWIRHVQIANSPDRGEPNVGELDIGYILGRLSDLDYDGWIGCEYSPRSTTEAGLSWMQTYPSNSSTS